MLNQMDVPGLEPDPNFQLETLTGNELDKYVVDQLKLALAQIMAELGNSTPLKGQVKKLYRGIPQALADANLPITSLAKDEGLTIGQRVKNYIGSQIEVDWKKVLLALVSQHVAGNPIKSPFISTSETEIGADDFGDVLVSFELPKDQIIDIDYLAEAGKIDLSQGGMSLSGTGHEAEFLYLGDVISNYLPKRQTAAHQRSLELKKILAKNLIEKQAEIALAASQKETPEQAKPSSFAARFKSFISGTKKT